MKREKEIKTEISFIFRRVQNEKLYFCFIVIVGIRMHKSLKIFIYKKRIETSTTPILIFGSHIAHIA